MEPVATAFKAGGFFMWPILVVSVLIFIAGIRYAIDTEPIRLKFIAVLALLLPAFGILGTTTGMILTLQFALSVPPAEFGRTIAQGISESINCIAFCTISLVNPLIFIAIGVYRAGRRELKALKP